MDYILLYFNFSYLFFRIFQYLILEYWYISFFVFLNKQTIEFWNFEKEKMKEIDQGLIPQGNEKNRELT